MEAQVYQVLRDRLPGVTIVSIGHRRTLAEFHHDRRVRLERDGAVHRIRAALSGGVRAPVVTP